MCNIKNNLNYMILLNKVNIVWQSDHCWFLSKWPVQLHWSLSITSKWMAMIYIMFHYCFENDNVLLTKYRRIIHTCGLLFVRQEWHLFWSVVSYQNRFCWLIQHCLFHNFRLLLSWDRKSTIRTLPYTLFDWSNCGQGMECYMYL